MESTKDGLRNTQSTKDAIRKIRLRKEFRIMHDHIGCPVADQFKPFDLLDPFPFYAFARAEEPIFFSEELGYWIVTRYADAKAIFKQWHIFSSEITQSPYKSRPSSVTKVLTDGGFAGRSGLSGRMPPDHTRLRKFVNKAFTPRRLRVLEQPIRALVTDYIDRFINDGRADLVSQFAYDLPAQVIFLMLGVPQEDVNDVKRWAASRIYLNFGDLPEEEQVHHAHNLVQYWQYCVRLVEQRFDKPTDDLTGDLVRLHLDGDRSISKHEIASLCYGQLTAGHETTSNLLANGLKDLLTYRSNWQAICNDPALIPNAVEEILRFGPSVFTWRRLVTQATEINGIQFQPGDRILLAIGSANHDDAHFADGDQMDVRRKNAKDHLAFGHGIHYCLGSSLARLESRIALEELSRRLPQMRLVPNQTFEYPRNSSFRGPEHVWVEWTDR